MSDESDRLLTPAEVARLFGVDAKTVTRWALDGKLPYIRTLGGHRRFYARDVCRYLDHDDPSCEGGQAQ